MLFHTVRNNPLIISQIINKIEIGLIENRGRLKKSLLDKPQEELKHAIDGRPIDIDWAFEGIELVNKITEMLKKIKEEKELKDNFSYISNKRSPQLLQDLEKLNNLEFHKIMNDLRSLFCSLDDILQYLLKEHLTIELIKERLKDSERKKIELKSLRREHEKLKEKEDRFNELKEYIIKFDSNYYYYCFDDELKRLLEQVKKESLLPRPELLFILKHGPVERRKKWELKIKEIQEMLEATKCQLEVLETEIDRRVRNDYEKAKKILDLQKQYIGPINEERKKQYDNLKLLLTMFDPHNIKYLESYYKFKAYRKKYSRWDQLNRKTLKELIELKLELDSIK
jgi:hypothetical protein